MLMVLSFSWEEEYTGFKDLFASRTRTVSILHHNLVPSSVVAPLLRIPFLYWAESFNSRANVRMIMSRMSAVGEEFKSASYLCHLF